MIVIILTKNVVKHLRIKSKPLKHEFSETTCHHYQNVNEQRLQTLFVENEGGKPSIKIEMKYWRNFSPCFNSVAVNKLYQNLNRDKREIEFFIQDCYVPVRFLNSTQTRTRILHIILGHNLKLQTQPAVSSLPLPMKSFVKSL